MAPRRAVFCPVLRYVILTASAGHLSRLIARRGNSGTGIVAIKGIKLPGLTMDAAAHYHDICISYLLELSKAPNEQYIEDTIIAATILQSFSKSP